VTHPAQQLETALILADAITLRRILVGRDPLRSLHLVPLVAMFAIESFAFFSRRGFATGSFGPHSDVLTRWRHSVKFLDDSRQSVSAALEHNDLVVAASVRAFQGAHTGWLGPLKRKFQTDLGLYLEDGQLVGTTHVTTAQLALEPMHLERLTLADISAQSQVMHERAQTLGEYLAKVINAFGLEMSPATRTLAPFVTIDVKSRPLYSRLVDPDAPRAMGTAMFVTAVLSTTNAARFMLPKLLDDVDPCEQHFLTKWRIVALFHGASSMKRLLNEEHTRPTLRAPVRQSLTGLCRRLRHVGRLKKLRDTFVHYGLRANGGEPKLGTVVTGRPMAAVNAVVEAGLDEMSKTLTTLVGPLQ